jgi:hypothetical protein
VSHAESKPAPRRRQKNNSRQSNNQQQDKGTSNLEPENINSYSDNTSDVRLTTCNDESTFQEQRTQHGIIKIDPSDITEKIMPVSGVE